MDLNAIQEKLLEEGFDGWLFFDHHHRDPIAYRVLGLEAGRHVSRRWYYWIPATGEPVKLTHRIEHWMLDALPGAKVVYSGWREQRERLGEILDDQMRIAMQYSPDCMIPYVSLVDAGTVEMVRELGKAVFSSASLVQAFEAVWSAEQLAMHEEAGRRVDAIRAAAFARIGDKLRAGETVREHEVAQFILDQFAAQGLVTQDGPIVGVNANSGNPHYAPDPAGSAEIKAGDFVLIDLWAKLDKPKAVYYDITWTGFCGETAPEKIRQVFDIVTRSRDAALEAVDKAMREGRQIAGWEVDDVTRGVITGAGYGEAFVHRTGHSIGENVHGNGVNIDNLETRDERPIVPGVCFSIEPGIYLPEFGVRSEIDCFVLEGGAKATGEVQRELVRVL
ncbi:MAG: M24 family metallopeptidase [Acidobacteria bacterium]|nr:M24 family metallopeptidase [Acidobacteriota bacterium]